MASVPSYVGQLHHASYGLAQPVLYVNDDGICIGQGSDSETLHHIPFDDPDSSALTVWTLPNAGAAVHTRVRADVAVYKSNVTGVGATINAARLPAGGGSVTLLGYRSTTQAFGRPSLPEGGNGYVLNEEG